MTLGPLADFLSYPVDTARSNLGLTPAIGVPADYHVCPNPGTYIKKITLYGDCAVNYRVLRVQ
jgi:hypothetical protein